MPVIIGASIYGTVRSGNGVDYAELDVLSGHYPFVEFENHFMTFGPGATADVPGSRLYWVEPIGGVGGNGCTIWYTNGYDVVNMLFDPSGGFDDIYDLVYDRASDRLYLAYSHFNNRAGACGSMGYSNDVAYFDGSTWTVLPMTRAIGATCGALAIIPTGVHAGQLLYGWGQDCADFANYIQRYNGAAWVNDYVSPSTILASFYKLKATSDSVIACMWDDGAGVDWIEDLVVKRSAAGVWTDITPPSWRGTAKPKERKADDAIEYLGDLYVAFHTLDLTSCEIWKRTPAGAWSLEQNLLTALPPDPVYGVVGHVYSFSVIDGTLYCGMDRDYLGSKYLTKTGTVWTLVPLTLNIHPDYVEGSIQYFLESRENTVDPPSGNTSGVHSPIISVFGNWDRVRPFAAWNLLNHNWLMGSDTYHQLVDYDVGIADPATYYPLDGQWLLNGSTEAYPPTPYDANYYRDVRTASIVNLGSPDESPFGGIYTGDIDWAQTIHTCGEVEVIDPFVLRCRPPNGKGLANIAIQDFYYTLEVQPFFTVLPAELAPVGYYWARRLATTYIEGCYTFECPQVTSIAASSGDILGGNTVTLTGTNFHLNQRRDGLGPRSRAYRFYNQVLIRTASGRVEVANPETVDFIDTEHVSFVMPPFPGGNDPVVEVIFEPSALAHWGFSSHNWRGTYRCPSDIVAYTYTNVEATGINILGSIDTVLGLGGEGGDIIIGPTAPTAGPLPPFLPPTQPASDLRSAGPMSVRLGNLCERVLYRLGDSDQKIWTTGEIDTYLEEAGLQLVERTRFVWDQLFVEDIPPGFDHNHPWEAGLLEYEFDYGEANHNHDWEGLQGVDSDLWYEEDVAWAAHTSPADVEHLPSAGIGRQHATAEMSNALVEIDRVAWDRRDTAALSPRHLGDQDSRYEITEGEVYGFTWRKDGPRTIRKIRVPNSQADTITHEGSWGIPRDTLAAHSDPMAGAWGIPRRITSYHPMGNTVGFGTPRRFYQDGTNFKVEHWRKFDITCDMTQLKDGVIQRLAGEIPRHYFMYLADFCQMKALRRNGPGQNYKLAQLYADRWERNVARIKSRVDRKNKQRTSRMGGHNPGGQRSGPPRPRLPWQYGSKIR